MRKGPAINDVGTTLVLVPRGANGQYNLQTVLHKYHFLRVNLLSMENL